jgi:hypothetical protein
MLSRIDELIQRIKELEEELESEFRCRREEFRFTVEARRVRFADEVARFQRRMKTGLFRYLRESRPLNILTAPLIYSGFIPFALLDLFITIYQSVCFPIYRIPRVRRGDHFLFDRQDLSYLNIIEKCNCFYCAYANGVAAYVREVSARTEQYWCPIKHSRRMRASHGRYHRFFEYGDAESYCRGLERLRGELERELIRQGQGEGAA